MPSLIQTTLNPGMYHGFNARPPYFEGWYYKLVSADHAHRYAVIPGIILGEDAHAFIQILNGTTGQAAYHTFPVDDFRASDQVFEVTIGENRFSADRISLAINNEVGRAAGELRFQGGTPWPVSLLSPGIMGWYSWVPRMECYHGVLSFDHIIQGELNMDHEVVDFSGGHGYIEKDWGQSFPSAWVWFQTNHFATPSTCLTASVAMIPWMGSAFRGFIIGLRHEERLFRFATYTGAKIEKLSVREKEIHWVVRDRKYRLEMTAHQAPGGVLLGPTKIEMGKRVTETLNASVDVRLSTLRGDVVFEENGRFAGLEVNGNLDQLLSAR